jgi:hypothetical protein
MKFLPLALFLVLGAVGCQSSDSVPETSTKQEATRPASASADHPEGDSPAKVTAGMGMADVKKLKGAPKDTKHEHGPNGSEIDLWIFDDETVRFQDGKVVQ